ncbi:MAG: hypothetical protein U1C73_17325 [Dietzia sp.]|nr:hypothetical protein [Dietzia sp.]
MVALLERRLLRHGPEVDRRDHHGAAIPPVAEEGGRGRQAV